MEYYNLLNLSFDATPEEIRAAYFDAARKYHPDASDDMVDGKLFMSIQEAYEVLSNVKRRKAYDETIPAESRENSGISIETLYSRSALLNDDSPQLLYVLLNIRSTKIIDPQDRTPVHLCVVLDRSTSMSGERMDMVRKNLAHLIHWMKPTDVISVVAFSDRAEVIIEPTECQDSIQIVAKLNGLHTSGATEIYQGLELGFDLFKRFGEKDNYLRHLILMTDGHTYGDEDACYQMAKRANIEGIIFNAVGIGDEWNDAFLDRLASLGGGNAVFIRNDQDLKHFVERKIQSLGAYLAQKAEIQLELAKNARLKYVFRSQPDVSPLDVNFPIQIGAVEYNGNTSVIFEFEVSELGKPGQFAQVAQGRIFLVIPSKTIPVERYFISFELPLSSTLGKEPVPPALMEAMSKISLYRLQEKAKQEVNEGKIDNATRHLKFLATRLMSQGDLKLAGQALSEAEHLQKYGNYSKDGDKIIKYGTRSLLMLPGPELNDHDQVP